MTKGETATYMLEVTLSTDKGELPADDQIAKLVENQMGGELDEETGLTCLGVSLWANLTTKES